MTNKILRYFDLHSGEENKKIVLENVTNNISFTGSNLWILACAILVASIGLNINSTAVIIGAMLISPLMGPIVGAGFSLGVYDFNLLQKSLKNLFIATLVGLVVSATYFYLSPFKETQSELLSRTAPNIYDVLIAFFCGIAGVVALTRKDKVNPIVPGVAIATALIPPLCTAGYGIAIGNVKYFFGAIFLYTINSVFICLATYSIVKYLKFPQSKHLNLEYQKKVKYGLTVLTLVLIFPSIYFAYTFIKEKSYMQNSENFISNEFTQKGYTVLYKKIDTHSNPKKIELAFLAKKFNKEEINEFNKKLNLFNLPNTQLIIKQDTTDIKKYILNELNSDKAVLNDKDLKISQLENIISSNHYDNGKILAEIKILFPDIENLSMSNHIYNEKTDSVTIIPIMIYRSNKLLSTSTKEKLILWLQQRLGKAKVEIYRQE